MINKINSGFHKYRIWMYLEYYLQIRLTHLIFQRASGEMLPYNFSPLNQKSNTLFFKKESIKSSILSSLIYTYQFFFSALVLLLFFFFFLLWFFLITTLDYKWKTLIKTLQASGTLRNRGFNAVLRTHPQVFQLLTSYAFVLLPSSGRSLPFGSKTCHSMS